MSGDADLVLAAVARCRKQGWQRVNCPLCVFATGKVDVRRSLGVNFKTGGYVCHKCQSTGLIAEYAPEEDVIGEMLASIEEIAAEPTAPRAPDTPAAEQELPDFEIESWFGYVPLASDPDAPHFAWARDYLAGRGITWDTIVEAEVGAANLGSLRGRIVVPHWAPDGRLAGWIGRDVTGSAYLKYRYSRGMHRQLLWNQRQLSLETEVPLALVEGVFDALPLWPDVVAFLGKPTTHHVATLSAHRGRPIVVVLDGDARYEGWALGNKLKLAGVPRVGFARLPPGEDPGSLGRDRVQALVWAASGRIGAW